ncbi:MAG: toprim domain-containing protein, partial [Nitrospinaceae bacterium]|nr:toprim domain-containing protein [Nitrospinaceae bacterium]NIR56974.1 toprim domain-containing protein [Nitrospinaceae bacterium]NIS87431.1 toprim domain-containing protein [Nitrospinaceae bacterium]NIT84280.1 toprim domain-containing protein [Nitrospinaceae bacterium]NIU46470.1 toprim domain-containing protein [Nitrospinaceae bacterium]
QEAAEYFVHRLQQQGDDSPVRQYLKRRHLDAKTLASYQIGWALPAWRGLLTHLERKVQSSRADLEKAGLVVQKQGSQGDGFYDRFRGRLMFPLKDVHGKIIAFAGRVIDQGEPKYLNSPETPLYKKGRHLFGLDQAREAIRKEDGVLITEGYFDQIRCVQHGIRNVVASCGTALTPAQGELLKRFTRNVTLVFDSDSAGQSAARRGFEVLLEQGMQVKILVLPPGHDPDSFILQEGGEEFLRQIEIARPYIESYIMNVAETDNLGT